MSKIEEYAKRVRNDMELIHMSLRVFDEKMALRLYTAGSESMTIFDVMFYNEISQTLYMYD